VEDMIREVFGKDADMAIKVSWAENGSRKCDRVSKPNKNGTRDFGIFQINSVHMKKGYSEADLKDCMTNIKLAYEIFSRQGWNPWVAYTNGNYLNYK